MVKAVRLADDAWPELPGEFIFTSTEARPTEIGGMIFCCPCGCGNNSGIQFRNDANQGFFTAQWDGHEIMPTIAQLIRRTYGCKWVGYLKNGQFESI